MSFERWRRILCILATAVCSVAGQASLNLHARMSVGKTENMTAILEDATALHTYAKSQDYHSSIGLFMDNFLEQVKKLHAAATVVKEEKKKEKATTFTTGKYKLKELKKLRAKDSKKLAIPSMSVEEFEKKYKNKLEFTKPFLVKGGHKLLKDFDAARERFTADNFAGNEYLEKNTALEYFPPDQPRQKIVGNTIYFTQPAQIPFSRYLTNCFLGTPAAPKIPGQATEHCEQTVSSTKMVEKMDELDVFDTRFSDGKKIVDNVFYDWEKASKRFFSGNNTHSEIKSILGKEEGDKFIKQHASGDFRFFVMGASGSGDKLHAENGLPFFDVLIHGYRRWLLVKDDELQKVAEKAREALEFQETSAYMFFEEKLPELKEEFGLKKYIETNQEVGDIIFVPPGWYRVSLSLADSISYYEQMLYQPAIVESIVRSTVWNPQHRQFNLAFCYDKSEVSDRIKEQEISTDKMSESMYKWLDSQVQQVQDKDYPTPLMNVLTTCAKILSSTGKMSKLISLDKTKCSAKVWKACRSQLMSKTSKKKLKLDWLPEDITTVSDAKEEL